jgi:SAM-dependent methyltransferase
VSELEDPIPLPPPWLAHRVGFIPDDDSLTLYRELGLKVRSDILDLLPSDWSFEGRRVLDFGSGAGRILRHFIREAEDAEFYGCDIDAESIEWLERHLSPPLRVFRNEEAPPLPQPDAHFDLIWAASVFTHLTDHWSGWLLELHRVLKEGGLLIATFLGSGTSEVIAGEPWLEERIGMNVLKYGQSWDLGGPMVLISPWWIFEHWGRAFEVVTFWEAGFGNPDDRSFGHGVVVMRKTASVPPTQEQLEQIRPDEPREVIALQHNLRQVHQESHELRKDWERIHSRPWPNEEMPEFEKLRAELQAHKRKARARERQLRALKASRSWLVTRPLRQATNALRRLRER